MSQTTDLLKSIKALGLSQSEIRRRTNIPQPRLSKWESGSAPVAADDALRLRDLYEQEVLVAKVCESRAPDAQHATRG